MTSSRLDGFRPEATMAALAEHPKLDDLAQFVRVKALQAAQGRQADFAARGRATGAFDGVELRPEDAQTGLGNVLTVLDRGAETTAERELLSVLLAIGVVQTLPRDSERLRTLAGDLVWLAARTPCNALPYLDRLVDDDAERLWALIAQVVQQPQAVAQDFNRTEALVAAAALAESRSRSALRARTAAAHQVADPALLALLTRTPELPPRLEGELVPPPLSPLVAIAFAVTLLPVVFYGVYWALRKVLGVRNPAHLSLSERGLELEYRTELLGKLLKEKTVLVPLGALERVSREVRYARLGLYAGLLALVLGTYVGMGLFVDGIRVPGGSPSLIVLAVFLFAGGVLLDFVLSGAVDSARGKCRVVVVPHRGQRYCVGALSPELADVMLLKLVERLRGAAPAAKPQG